MKGSIVFPWHPSIVLGWHHGQLPRLITFIRSIQQQVDRTWYALDVLPPPLFGCIVGLAGGREEPYLYEEDRRQRPGTNDLHGDSR